MWYLCWVYYTYFLSSVTSAYRGAFKWYINDIFCADFHVIRLQLMIIRKIFWNTWGEISQKKRYTRTYTPPCPRKRVGSSGSKEDKLQSDWFFPRAFIKLQGLGQNSVLSFTMIFVYSLVSYMTYVPLQILCRVPLIE